MPRAAALPLHRVEAHHLWCDPQPGAAGGPSAAATRQLLARSFKGVHSIDGVSRVPVRAAARGRWQSGALGGWRVAHMMAPALAARSALTAQCVPDGASQRAYCCCSRLAECQPTVGTRGARSHTSEARACAKKLGLVSSLALRRAARQLPPGCPPPPGINLSDVARPAPGACLRLGGDVLNLHSRRWLSGLEPRPRKSNWDAGDGITAGAARSGWASGSGAPVRLSARSASARFATPQKCFCQSTRLERGRPTESEKQKSPSASKELSSKALRAWLGAGVPGSLWALWECSACMRRECGPAEGRRRACGFTQEKWTS